MREDHTAQSKNPTKCRYWHEPKLLQSDPLQDRFELLKTYVKDEHFWQYLLRCRECGQLYFMQFSESIDWVNGNDPQFTIYVPVGSQKESDRSRKKGFKDTTPRLHIDFPSEAKQPMLYWVAGTGGVT